MTSPEVAIQMLMEPCSARMPGLVSAGALAAASVVARSLVRALELDGATTDYPEIKRTGRFTA